MPLKQGLNYLIEEARQRGYRPHYDQKATIIPIFSFINQLIASIKGFLNTRQYDCWYVYFLDQHLYDRTLANMIKSWQKLKDTSLECHLLQTLLTVRNRNKLRMYLKTRKYILQTASENAMLDEVLLDLQDSIAIIHKIFANEEIRKALVQGIRNIFLAFKISQAKLYSSVLIEYLLAVYDSIIRIQSEQATISGQFVTKKSTNSNYNSNYQELFSSISNFQSTIHNENGLYKKSNFSHTHATQKKYQIIEKKFLPLKQTSQYISNVNSNLPSSTSKHKNSLQKDKSHFYDFISNKNDLEEYLSQTSNALKIQPSHFSQSYEDSAFQKQQQFYRNLNIQPSHDKSSSPSPQPKKQISYQRKPVSPQPNIKFGKNKAQVNPVQVEPPKSFSLQWFSNKFFQTDNEPQSRQSFLRKSRQIILKKADQKRRQSKEKYEIENLLVNTSSKRINDSKLQKDYCAESDKSEQFEKMVTKNQQFKQKMLKKSNVEAFSGSQKDLQSKEDWNSRFRLFDNEDQQKERNFQNLKFDSESQGVVQFTSNFGVGYNISSESLRMMKKRNEQILNDMNGELQYDSRHKPRNPNNQQEEVYSFKKRKIKVESSPQFVERPHIIHKSIGDKKMTYFSKYANNETESFFQNSRNLQVQQEDQRSSYQMGKMKSLLRIIDDYRQNAVQIDSDDNQLEISESFYKKSKFNSEKNMDSIQQNCYDEV